MSVTNPVSKQVAIRWSIFHPVSCNKMKRQFGSGRDRRIDQVQITEFLGPGDVMINDYHLFGRV